MDKKQQQREKQLRERRLRTEEDKRRMLAMVKKRQTAISYLREVLLESSESFWLHSALLEASELNAGFTTNEILLKSFYSLAYSIFAIKEKKRNLAGVAALIAYAQLMEEWEYHFKGQTMMKFMMAHNSLSVNPSRMNTPSLNVDEEEDTSFREDKSTADKVSGQGVEQDGGASARDRHEKTKAVLFKFHKTNSVVYEYLHTPHIPSQHLDNAQVLRALTDALDIVYSSFLDKECLQTQGTYEIVSHLDATFRKIFFSPYYNEITEFAMACIETEFRQII